MFDVFEEYRVYFKYFSYNICERGGDEFSGVFCFF